tara:strand:- start:509 stop:757 length:249 start_codon:yes stop_codon:yes gene_type:complete
MKKLRRIKPGQRKRERREAQAELQKRAAAFLDHATECTVCGTEFERTVETVKTWQVMVKEDQVRLTCPRCWGLVLERLEKEQ